MADLHSSLDKAAYFSFATFRLSGAAVATPVWFGGRKGSYYVFSAPDAGKVKRLRNSSRAQVAICDLRGKLLGPWIDAEATIIESADEKKKALKMLRDKYGWQMLGLDLVSKLGGRFGQRVYIRVTVPAAS